MHSLGILTAIAALALDSSQSQLANSPNLIFIDEFEPVNYRFTDLKVRDPHFFLDFLQCNDITDTPFAGFSINGELQTEIQTDGDNDGFLDLSELLYLYPLNENDGAMGAADFGTANCSATAGPCSSDGSSVLTSIYTSQGAGQCLAAIAGTTHPYSPAVGATPAPCFVTSPATFNLNIAGALVTLQNAKIAASYDNTSASTLSNGLISGFISQADADATLIPSNVPIFGGKSLSSLLAGGTGSCPTYSDKDSFNAVTGWQFYLNFNATKVVYVP